MPSLKWLARQSSALGFIDAARTDPSTNIVPVLNHGAVVSGLTRAHDLSGGEDAKHIDNANGKKYLALIMQKGRQPRGNSPHWPEDDAAREAPSIGYLKRHLILVEEELG